MLLIFAGVHDDDDPKTGTPHLWIHERPEIAAQTATDLGKDAHGLL